MRISTGETTTKAFSILRAHILVVFPIVLQAAFNQSEIKSIIGLNALNIREKLQEVEIIPT